MQKNTKKCLNCGSDYSKKYGVALTQWNKSKFCSKPCAKEYSFKKNIQIIAPKKI